MKPVGRDIAYKLVTQDGNKETYAYNNCGGEIIAARVAHPVWDSALPAAGSGDVKCEQVPYCPNCEDKSNHNRMPIQAGPPGFG